MLGQLSVLKNLLTATFPNVEAFRIREPLYFIDQFVSKSVQFVLISLVPEIDFKIILSNDAIDAPLIRLLDVELGELLFVRVLFGLGQLVHGVRFLSIARLVLDLCGWTWSFGLVCALVLVIGQKTLQSIVTVVLLLLQDADMMVDDPVDLVKLGCAHL